MTDFPKAPSTGGHASDSDSDDVFELDDVDFQRVDPTGKFKMPQHAADATAPVGTDAFQVVTGEISVENTPAPQARPTSQAPQSPPAAAPKNARAALQEALAQLQKNKQASALANEPTPAPGASTPRPQSQTQSSGGFAAPPSNTTPAPQPRSTQAVAAPPPAAATPIASAARPADAAPENAPPPAAAQVRPGDAWRARNPPARATTPQEELTPLPGPAPTAAPWQAAITSEVALVPAEAPIPSPAMPAAASQEAQEQAAMRITGEMQATGDTSEGWGGSTEVSLRPPTPASLAPPTMLGAPLPASLAPPTSAAPPPAAAKQARDEGAAPASLAPPPAAQAPRPAPEARPSLADQARAAKRPQATSAPRPSLADQARMARGPAGVASRPPPASLHTPMTDGEVTTPSEFKGAPQSISQGTPQDMPFQKPLLTPLAGGPESVKGFVSTTAEVAFNEALPPVPTFPPTEQAPLPPPTEPSAPAWTLQAPHEEAPAMMNLLTSGPHAAMQPAAAIAPSPEPSATLGQASTFAEPSGPLGQRDDLDPMGMPTLESLADEDSQAQHAADPRALTRDMTGTADARSPTQPFPPSALPPAPPPNKRSLKRLLPLAAGAAALLCMAVLLVVRHHAAPPPVQVAPIAKAPPSAKPKEAHKDKVHAPKPVLPQVTEPLTDDNVDRLGYRALALGVEALANNPRGDPGLLLWAQWRLASHFDDAGAKAALARAVDDLPLRGRVDTSSPLLTAAQAGAAITLGRIPLAKRLIIALAKSPGAKLWQTWYVQTVWQARRTLPPVHLIAQLDRILRASPNNADARLWRAEALLRRNLGEGVRVLAELARHKDPDVIARVAQVYTRFGLTQALAGVLEPLGDGSSILQAAPAHQGDLLRLFTASRVLRGDYEAPRSIAEALARGDGDAPAVATWARLTQYEGDDPGSVLQQGIDAQSDKTLRGWLLYEAVRLALERHDMNHAKFLADGMNSMQPGDIGVFAPLAAAKVDWARNQQKQAKHQLASAQAIAPDNRYVQIALATLDTGTPELPVRWAGAPPVPPEVLWQRAHATAAVGQGSAAAHMAEEIFWRDPTLFDPVVLLGAWSGWLDQAGEALRAESLLERIVPALPDDDRPVIQLIKQARRGKRYDAAIQWYEVLLKRRPSDPELTVELAKTYIDAQQPEVAARVLSAAEHADPNVRTPVFMTTMAGALSKSDPTKARNLLAVALRVQPSRDSYVLLADMENAAGHPEEELRALQAALPLAPDDGPLHLRVANLLRGKRMNNQAMALLQPLTNHAEAMEMLGDLLQESGDIPDAMIAYQRADTAYQRADTARPDQAGLLVKIGVLQLNGLHNATAAIKTLQKAVSVAPQHADTFYWLSRAFARSGMHGVAKKLLMKYLRLAPDGTFADDVRRELASNKRGAPAGAAAE